MEIIVTILVLLFIGWVISIPLLISFKKFPSLILRSQNNRSYRIKLIFFNASLTILISFLLLTIVKSFMVSYPSMLVSHITHDAGEEYGVALRASLTKEIWLRQITPKPISKDCYSEPTVCKLADAVISSTPGLEPIWELSLVSIVIIMLLATPGAYFTYRYTRPPKPPVEAEHASPDKDAGAEIRDES